VEKNHKFLKRDDVFFRTNEIWRTTNATFKTGALIEEELMFKNFGKIKYKPKEYEAENGGNNRQQNESFLFLKSNVILACHCNQFKKNIE
jgi:hypothetical protein